MHGSLGDLELDALLRQRAWLRGLAQALVGPDAADDLVQETWLTALDSDAGPHASLRAWLTGIVRNLARRERRRHGRRAELIEPESVAARTPTSDELLARAELQERLIVAVRALREPYRTTVLLRYFEELSIEELSARMGVPSSTGRTRLARALAELRATLDRAGGGREAWSAIALALGNVHAPSGALGSLGEGLVMGMKTKLAAGAALAAALAGVVVWRVTREPGGDSVRADVVAAAASEADSTAANATPSSSILAAGSSAERTALQSVPASAAFDEVLLYGSVRDSDGKPLALESSSLEDELGFVRDGRSATPGSWSIAGLHPGRWRLRARAREHVSLDEELTIRGDQEHERRDLVLPPALAIPIRLVDEAGQLLTAGSSELTTTGPLWVVATREPPGEGFSGMERPSSTSCGEFTDALEERGAGAPAGFSGLLRLRVPLPVCVSVIVYDATLATQTLTAPVDELCFTIDRTLLATRLGSLRARFVDAASGALLVDGSAALDPPRHQTVGGRPLGAPGIALFEQQAPGLYHLRFFAPGHEDFVRGVRVTAGSALDLGDVPVPAAASIRGHAVDAQGTPVKALVGWAELAALRTPLDVPERMRETNAGEFEIPNAVRGALLLVVQSDDRALFVRTIDASSGLVGKLVVTLEEGVRVVLRHGRESIGRQVTLADANGLPFVTWTLGERPTSTRLVPGHYQLWTGAAERVDARREFDVGGETLVLAIDGSDAR